MLPGTATRLPERCGNSNSPQIMPISKQPCGKRPLVMAPARPGVGKHPHVKPAHMPFWARRQMRRMVHIPRPGSPSQTERNHDSDAAPAYPGRLSAFIASSQSFIRIHASNHLAGIDDQPATNRREPHALMDLSIGLSSSNFKSRKHISWMELAPQKDDYHTLSTATLSDSRLGAIGSGLNLRWKSDERTRQASIYDKESYQLSMFNGHLCLVCKPLACGVRSALRYAQARDSL